MCDDIIIILMYDVFSHNKQNRKSNEGCSKRKVGKSTARWENWSQRLEHKQVPKKGWN